MTNKKWNIFDESINPENLDEYKKALMEMKKKLKKIDEAKEKSKDSKLKF